MKNVTLAFIASTVGLSAAKATFDTGPYLGATIGYGSIKGQYSIPGAAPGNSTSGSQAVGDSSINGGVHAGYGVIKNCLYLGCEVVTTYDNSKINNTLNGIVGGVPLMGQSQLKRDWYLNVALRGGYLIVPSTMAYLRLGTNVSKWTFNDTNSFSGPFTPVIPASGSKNASSFVPGVGVETALNRHVYLRLEYMYEVAPSLTATNVFIGGQATRISNIRCQSTKAGMSYKF